MDADERISMADAARRSGHSAVALRKAAQRGALRAERIGDGVRATYYTTARDLDAYLDGRRTWRAYDPRANRDEGSRKS